MNETFTWTFEGEDKLSKSARDGAESLSAMEKELKRVEEKITWIKQHPVEFKELKKLRREFRELSDGPKSFAKRIEEMGERVKHIGFIQDIGLFAEGFKLAGEVGEKVIDTVIDIGKEALKSAGEAERMSIAFESLTGSKKAGKEVQEYLDRIRGSTELTGSELEQLSAHLMTAGFKAKDLQTVLPAALDISGFLGGGVEKAQAAAEALAHIKSTGELSKRSIGALGLEWSKVMDEMKRETGLTEEGIKRAMASGKFGDQAIHAVEQSIVNKQHGALGTTAEKIGHSLDADMKHLKELPDLYFKKLSTTEGFGQFKGWLSKFTDEMSPDSPFGQKMQSELGGLFTSIFGGLATQDPTAALQDGLLKAVKGAHEMVDEFKQAWPDIKAGAGEVWDLLKGIAKTVGMIADGWKQLHDLAHDMDTGRFYKDVADWATGERGGIASDKVNQYSPDWKRARAAAAAGQVIMRESTTQVFGEPAIPSQASRVSPVSQNRSVSVGDVHVHVDASGAATTEEAADQIGKETAGQLQRMTEKLAIASGAM